VRQERTPQEALIVLDNGAESVLTLAPPGTPIRLVRVLKNGAWQYPVLNPGMACCLDDRR
jgi:hypothetical protein